MEVIVCLMRPHWAATSAFNDKKGFGLKEYATEDAKKQAEKMTKEQAEKEGPLKYGEAERKGLSNAIFGAIYKVTLDASHPLAFGKHPALFLFR